MKLYRLIWISVASGAALLLLLVALALVPAVQTWAARRVLLAQLGPGCSLGRLAVGWHDVRVENLHLEQAGWAVTLPLVEADVSLSSALQKRVKLRRLVAKGWSVAVKTPPTEVPAGRAAAAPFTGVLQSVQLPVDFSLEAVELAGEVVLPTSRVQLAVTGGQLGAGRQGSLDFTTTVRMTASGAVNSIQARGTLLAAMDTPRTFGRLAVQIDTEAQGTQLPQGARLTLAAEAARAVTGESYQLQVVSVGKRLLFVQADWPAAGTRLVGSWKADMQTADLAPFVAGLPLPGFTVVGAGRFMTDLAGTEAQTAGRFELSLDNLAVLRRELAALGTLRAVADFDVRRQGETWRVERLSATVDGAQPALRVEALQAFAVRTSTGELQLSDPSKDLATVTLLGVPLAWVQPWLGEGKVSGGPVRGELAAAAKEGHFSLHTSKPLTVENVSLSQGGRILVRALDALAEVRADSSAQGWQAELSRLELRSGTAILLQLDARAGQLAGAGQPVKVQTQWQAELPAWVAQPVLAGQLTLQGGTMHGRLAASIGSSTAVQANVRCAELRVGNSALPEVVAEVRADVAADGRITLQMPVTLVQKLGARTSDLTLSGSLQPRGGGGVVDGMLLGQFVALEDVQALTALTAVPAPVVAPLVPGTSVPAVAPIWSGWSGRLSVAVKALSYNGELNVNDVAGTLRVDEGTVKLEEVRAGLAPAGRVQLNGEVRFEATTALPYAVVAQSVVEDFEVGALFRALDPTKPPTVEGKFSLRSQVKGRAANLNALVEQAQTETAMTSKGGLFRIFGTDVAEKVQRSQSTVEAIGGFLGSVVRSERLNDYANRTKIVNDIAKGLAEIPFDQLSLQLGRDAEMNLKLQDFTLISPEVRLSGAGEIRGQQEASCLGRPLVLALQMSVRGQLAELLGRAKLLNGEKDNLGYARVARSLEIKGTLQRPDAQALVTLLLESALFK